MRKERIVITVAPSSTASFKFLVLHFDLPDWVMLEMLADEGAHYVQVSLEHYLSNLNICLVSKLINHASMTNNLFSEMIRKMPLFISCT